MLKVTNIKWDTDGQEVDLPTEITITRDVIESDDAIADYLSDEYGWCVENFIIEDVPFYQLAAFDTEQDMFHFVTSTELEEVFRRGFELYQSLISKYEASIPLDRLSSYKKLTEEDFGSEVIGTGDQFYIQCEHSRIVFELFTLRV